MLDICMSPSFVSRSKVTPPNWNISACSCEQWKNVSEFLNLCASELLITFRNSEKVLTVLGELEKFIWATKDEFSTLARYGIYSRFYSKALLNMQNADNFWKLCFHTIKAHWRWSVPVSLSLCSAAFNTTCDRCPPDNITQRTNSKII